MLCMRCGEKTGVIWTSTTFNVERTRRCKTCGHQFRTIEVSQEELDALFKLEKEENAGTRNRMPDHQIKQFS